jgi:hypothetical protein
MLALPRKHAFSDLFLAYLLARNIRYEENLVDQLFQSGKPRVPWPRDISQSSKARLFMPAHWR